MQVRHRDQGFTAYEQGRHVDAIQHFNNAIQDDPTDAKAFFLRGHAHKALDDYQNAFSDWSKALELDSEYLQAYCCRAAVYRYRNELDKAVEEYGHALLVNDKYIPAYYHRAATYKTQRKYDEAINDYSQVINIELNEPDLLNSKLQSAFACRAELYIAQARYDEAIIDYNYSIKLDNQCAAFYWGRAYAYTCKGLLHEAVLDYIQTVDLDLSNKQYYDHLKKFDTRIIFSVITTLPPAKQVKLLNKCLNQDEPLGQIFVHARKNIRKQLQRWDASQSALKHFRITLFNDKPVNNSLLVDAAMGEFQQKI